MSKLLSREELEAWDIDPQGCPPPPQTIREIISTALHYQAALERVRKIVAEFEPNEHSTRGLWRELHARIKAALKTE